MQVAPDERSEPARGCGHEPGAGGPTGRSAPAVSRPPHGRLPRLQAAVTGGGTPPPLFFRMKSTPAPLPPAVRVILFNDAEPSRDVSADRLDELLPLKETQLLWIDVTGPDIPPSLAECIGVDPGEMHALRDDLPALAWRPPWKYLRVQALNWQSDARSRAVDLVIAVGPNTVVTAHAKAAQFLHNVLENESDYMRVGRLDAMTFAASLLDRMLTDYLDARDEFENMLDGLEIRILRKPSPAYLRDLQRLRHLASGLRQTLADHRDLFDAIGRPDFDPGLSGTAREACRSVRARYSHVIAAFENARELVNGSFDLYTSRIAESTNETMYTLTVATVVTGVLAVVAGVLGMNFQAPLFQSGGRGFAIAVAGMAGFGMVVLVLTFWLRWRARRPARSRGDVLQWRGRRTPSA